jgi:hypothetical protein
MYITNRRPPIIASLARRHDFTATVLPRSIYSQSILLGLVAWPFLHSKWELQTVLDERRST